MGRERCCGLGPRPGRQVPTGAHGVPSLAPDPGSRRLRAALTPLPLRRAALPFPRRPAPCLRTRGSSALGAGYLLLGGPSGASPSRGGVGGERRPGRSDGGGGRGGGAGQSGERSDRGPEDGRLPVQAAGAAAGGGLRSPGG